MTKYILHGGETGVPNEHNKAFYREWVKDFDSDFIPTILLVYFSRKSDEWEKLEGQDRERFARYTNERKTHFIVASNDTDTFRGQIKGADVVYARGGSSEDLIQALEPLKGELKRLLDGKVYAGSSAGVMVLSHYTRSPFEDWKKGLDILPINSIIHYSESMGNDLGSFKKSHQDNDYEYLLLPETEFAVKYF